MGDTKDERELPEGWCESTIGRICDYISRGKSPKYIDHSSLPVVNQKAIRWDGIEEKYLKYIDPEQYMEFAEERYIEELDVLWNSTGTGTIGRACIVSSKDIEQPKVVDSHVTILRANKRIADPHFLFFWIRSDRVQKNIEELATGTTNQIELNRSTVLESPVLLPPLPEQKRIVAKLDSLLCRVEAVRARLGRVPEILASFRKAVLSAAVSGELTREWREENGVNEKWEETQVKKVGKVQLGRQRSPQYHNGQKMVKYLRVQNVFEDRIDTSDVMEMDFPGDDFINYKLKYGDVLLNEGQSPIYLGRPAMYKDELPEACFTNTLIRFRANKELKPEYALLVFRHYMHSGRFKSEGTITTNIAHLGAGRFAEIEFNLPSLPEQREIVRRVEALFAIADRIEARYQVANERVEGLTASILAKAFRGELVPQDPNDEPASVLLERIKKERESGAETGKRKTRMRAAEEGMK